MTPPTNHRARSCVAAAAATMALTVAACGSSSTTASSSATTPSPGSTVPAPAGSGSSAPTGTTLTATLTEFHIAMSAQSVPAGSYTITVSNAGTTLHAFDVAGSTGTIAQTGPVLPGQTKTVSVTLAAGTYQVYCPVGNHRAMGMDTVLTVSGAAGAGAGSGASSSTTGASHY